MRTHFVRNRPVMKPPKPDESHCTTMSQTPAAIVNAVAEAPAFGHGDRYASPSPEPSNISIKDVEAAATAPPNIAAHEIAETGDSATARESDP
jgi:hypothetical protein